MKMTVDKVEMKKKTDIPENKTSSVEDSNMTHLGHSTGKVE